MTQIMKMTRKKQRFTSTLFLNNTELEEVDEFLDLGVITENHLRTFAPKSSYGEIFFISRLELGHKVLTPKMKKKMGVTDFVSEKMAVEKCLNFENSVIIARCRLICLSIENHKNKLLE